MLDEKAFLDHVQLRERGWTRGMVARFLRRPDRMGAVKHWKNYTGKALYAVDRVLSVEGLPEFGRVFKDSAARRKLSAEALVEIESARARGNAEYRSWLASLTPETVRLLTVAGDVAGLLKAANALGLRSPHK